MKRNDVERTHVMVRSLIVVVLAVFTIVTGCKKAQDEKPPSARTEQETVAVKPKSKGKPVDTTYAHFFKWSLSFDYPKEWQEHPAERVAMMKDYLAKELRPYDRELQEFAMIVGPNDETALLVMKYTTPTPMKPSEFVVERNQVYNDAMKAGDITKVNHVKEATFGNLPAVDEDVERSNGGRGRSFKLIDGTIVFEISFLVNDASQFSKYSAVLDHLVSSIKVAGKTERSQNQGGQK